MSPRASVLRLDMAMARVRMVSIPVFCILHVFVAGPNKHENLGCAEIPTTPAGHLVQSQHRARFLIQRHDNATGSVVLTLTDRGWHDLF